jgi:hypothetical protein
MNAADFIRNRNAYPTEKLLLHAGKYVAWSEDGTTILADADDMEGLFEAMDTRYPADTEYVISYVPAGWDGKHDPTPAFGTPFGPDQKGSTA